MTRWLAGALPVLWALLCQPTFAQSFPADPFSQELTAPTSLVPQAPRLRFELMAQLPLPGPLPSRAMRLVEEGVAIPVDGRIALTLIDAVGTPRFELGAQPPAAEGTGWAVSPDGRRRYGAQPNARIVAQKRCKRCKTGWKRRWRLRVPGSTVSPPLLHDRRLYFGGVDNRVHCVKPRNGHQVWTANIGARVTQPLVLWTGGLDTDIGRSLILIVPDDGLQLLALDGETGQRVARIELVPSEGRYVGVPLTTRDGRVLVRRQQYDPTVAELEVYRMAGAGAGPIGPRAPAPAETDDPAPGPQAPAGSW